MEHLTQGETETGDNAGDEVLHLGEKDVIYSKDNFELAIKYIKNGSILIEIETDILYLLYINHLSNS